MNNFFIWVAIYESWHIITFNLAHAQETVFGLFGFSIYENLHVDHIKIMFVMYSVSQSVTSLLASV